MADDRWLEDLLQKPEPYIDDGGFTARVMESLPATSPWRARMLALSAVAAALAVLVVPPLRRAVAAAGRLVGETALALVQRSPESAPALEPTAVLVACVLVAMVAWAGVALARHENG